MNRSTTWALGAVGVVAVTLIGYGTVHTSKVSTEPIKIGVIGPMSGATGFLGDGMRDAMLLAQKDSKATRHPYELIFEDDKLDSKLSASAANKLISVDKVDALVSFGSGAGNVVAPIAEQNKVLHFGIASDATIAKGQYNFIHWTPVPEENKVFVAELQRRGIHKLGIFEVKQQGVVAAVADLREQLQGTGIEIVTEQVFNFGETDFRTLIAKAKGSGAEIYLLQAFSPELEILGKQMKEAGVDTPVTSIEGFELTEQLDLFEGAWYVTSADPAEGFTQSFTTTYGTSPTLGAPNAYDIYNLIVAAAENVKGSAKPTPEEIASELMKITDFSGVLGTLNINEEGIVISHAVARMIQDGVRVTLPGTSE